MLGAGKFKLTMQIRTATSTLLTPVRLQALLQLLLELYLWQEAVELFFQALKHQLLMLNTHLISKPSMIFQNMATSKFKQLHRA